MARRQHAETTVEETTEAKESTTKSVEGTIKLLTQENPKRPGTKARARFDLYEDGMTVQQFLAAGGQRVDINWDKKHGFIEVV